MTQERYDRLAAQRRTARSARQRGSIDELPGGALRVRVYAGDDPVTKRRHDLVEIIPPGPQADRKARAARDRLVSQVAERRNPRKSATVDQLLDRYLDQFDGAPNRLTLSRVPEATTLRVFDERGDHLINQIPAPAPSPWPASRPTVSTANRTTG